MRGIRRVAPCAADESRPEDLRHAVKQAIIRHHRVQAFRGGPTKHSAYPNRGEEMSSFEFIQINPADYLNFLVVDVDQDDALIRLLHPAVPEPHWIIENPANGHAQAGWMIEPVLRGPGARPHPIRYAQEVQRALDLLTGNDAAFTRFLVRNPAAHSPAGDVRFGRRPHPYSLGELRRHMQDYSDPFDSEFSAWPSSAALEAPQKPAAPDTITGRNNAIFYRTRSELWRRYQDTGQLPALAESLDYAISLNNDLPTPLPCREIRDLAASAVRQVTNGKGRPLRGTSNPWFAEKGRKGGKSTTRSKRAAAVQNARKGTQTRTSQAKTSADVAGALRALGRTLAEIARELGKSIRTVQRYLSQAFVRDDITQASGSSPDVPSQSSSPVAKLRRHSPATGSGPSETSPTAPVSLGPAYSPTQEMRRVCGELGKLPGPGSTSTLMLLLETQMPPLNPYRKCHHFLFIDYSSCPPLPHCGSDCTVGPGASDAKGSICAERNDSICAD